MSFEQPHNPMQPTNEETNDNGVPSEAEYEEELRRGQDYWAKVDLEDLKQQELIVKWMQSPEVDEELEEHIRQTPSLREFAHDMFPSLKTAGYVDPKIIDAKMQTIGVEADRPAPSQKEV